MTNTLKLKVAENYISSYNALNDKKEVFIKDINASIRNLNGSFIESVTDLRKGSVIEISRRKYTIEKFSIKIYTSIINEEYTELYAIVISAKNTRKLKLVFTTDTTIEIKIKVISL